VSAGEEGSLLIWGMRTGRCDGYLEWAPATALTAVAFSPDGADVAAASSDGRVAVWEVRAAACPFAFKPWVQNELKACKSFVLVVGR
jgi:WD40 repeat protein